MFITKTSNIWIVSSNRENEVYMLQKHVSIHFMSQMNPKLNAVPMSAMALSSRFEYYTHKKVVLKTK